jgi:OPA family glycerol-3-phosphate transporter-like MFS transporter
MASAPQVQSRGLSGYFAEHRVLETYPTGWYRWWMLLLTVFATIVSFYEFGFSAMLPLWLPSLHFSREEFGWFLTCAVFLSGFSAMAGGPLADRHGRVVVIDLCLVAILVLTFCNLLMVGFWSFVVVRGLMNLVAGLMWGALGGLTRDMSPRVSRGAAFGLLTVGAVSCQWLWNQVPAWTLPIFHTWQSQIIIMGVIGVVLLIPVLLWLKDLSPRLRMMVMDSETAGETFESGDLPHEAPASAFAVFSQLLSKWEVWVLVVGVVAFLTTAITIQTFGPLMFTEAYHYRPAEAAAMTANFWLLNLLMLVPAGWFSDYLRVRKPITIVLAIVALALLTWWELNFFPPLSPSSLGWLTLILGGILAAAFIPWCALYSEYVEDISPSLQATGWSFFQLIYRTWVAFSGPLLLWVAAHYGWASWMWATVFGTALFLASMFILRGYWKPATSEQTAVAHGAPAHAAGR